MNEKAPVWLTVILWILAVFSLINGIEMFFLPSTWFFKLVPGVPETGPFNAHLVADGGTFSLALGVGLVFAALDPHRHAIAVLVAAVAGVMHSLLHLYSHAAGMLSDQHIGVEIVGIYVPTLILCALSMRLMRRARTSAPAERRAA